MAAKLMGVKEISSNRKAFHEYFVLERFEAGIELCGTEVKSIRAGNVNLKDSFCTIKDGELFVRGMHISPYEHGNIFNRDPVRPRRLLMHKREILRLNARVMQDGVALVPLRMYRPAADVFQGQPRKAGAGALQGQEAARQARQRGRTAVEARHRARDEKRMKG